MEFVTSNFNTSIAHYWTDAHDMTKQLPCWFRSLTDGVKSCVLPYSKDGHDLLIGSGSCHPYSSLNFQTHSGNKRPDDCDDFDNLFSEESSGIFVECRERCYNCVITEMPLGFLKKVQNKDGTEEGFTYLDKWISLMFSIQCHRNSGHARWLTGACVLKTSPDNIIEYSRNRNCACPWALALWELRM